MNKRIILAVITMAFIFLLVACNKELNTTNSHLALIQATNPSPATVKSELKEKEKVSKIEKDVESIDEIYDVAIVKGKEDILIAYKVKHLQRFHMKAIEKKLNKLLEKKYSKEDFVISSDYKIFLETVELTELMKKPDYSEDQANEKLNEIISLKKELT